MFSLIINFLMNNQDRHKIAILVFLSSACQFIVNSFLLINIGPNKELDEFYLALTVPQVVLSIIYFPLNSKFLPKLLPFLKRFKEFYGAVVIFTIISSILITASILFLYYFYLTNQPEFFDVYIIFILSIPLYALQSVLGMLCHIKRKFLVLECFNFLSSFLVLISLVLISYLLKYDISVELVACVFFLRYLIFNLFIFFGLGKPSLSYNAIRIVIRCITHSKGFVAGSMITKFEPIIERNILIVFGEGVLSLFYFAQQIFTFITQIVNKTYTSTKVPYISESWQKNNTESMLRTCNVNNNSFFALAILSVFSIILFWLLSKLGFEFGEISADDFEIFFTIFSLLIFQLIFNLPREFLNTVLLAKNQQNKIIITEISCFLIFNSAKIFSFLLWQNIFIFIVLLSFQAFAKYYITLSFIKGK